MIRCEHCGSALPDGAIFCGECGRAVTASASRLPAATAPVEQAPPPPLLQPDVHGRRPDPAADAWLPEATLDPATRAWLTGSHREDEQASAPTPVHRPDDPAQRSVPTDPYAAGSGPAPWTPTAGGASIDEPPLDPDAFASRPTTGPTDDDPEVTRVAERARRGAVADGTAPQAPTAPPTAPVWESPVQQDAPSWQPPAAREAAPAQPSTPSWWIGRSNSATQSTPTESSTDVAHAPGGGAEDAPEHFAAADGQRATPPNEGSGATQGEPERPAPLASPPQPGDTAVVEPLVDRRPAPQRPATQRPTPLVSPGSAGATCHVCGHTLEPDDIFCGECGAVRPAVTAAFTGPIVPLPVARPDWAADGDGPAEAGDTVAEHDEVATGTDTSTGTADGSADVLDDPVAAAEPSLGGSPADDDDQLFRAAVRPRGLHAAPAPDGDTPDVSATAGPVAMDGQTPTSAPLPPVPTAAPLPPIPGLPEPTPTTQLPATPLGRPVVPSSAGAELDDGNAPDDGLPDGTAPDDSAHDASARDEEPDVDETRIVSKTPTHAPFVLHFSTGERFGVHGTGLLGRLPRPQPGERFDDLLTVHDPGKSVSKTHLELGRDGGDLWVSDRFSGNGTVVRHIDGSIRRCEPGRRYRVERGARVDIGEQFFLVQ